MQVNKTKFERNSSLQYYHMTFIGKTKQIQAKEIYSCPQRSLRSRRLNRPLQRYVLFFQYRSCDNTLENCSTQISSYSLAYLRIIYEKTKGQVPLGPLQGKQNIQAKAFINSNLATTAIKNITKTFKQGPLFILY